MQAVLLVSKFLVIVGSCFFCTILAAQENRDYILKVDFGAEDRQADFWYNWDIRNSLTRSSRFFPHVFNYDGFGLTMESACGSSLASNCNMATRFRGQVNDSILDALVEDGLYVTSRQLSFELSDLAPGTYDFKGYFHDAMQSSDVRIGIRIFDARSPAGFLLSNTVRVSTGSIEPTVSTFTFPIESNGQSPIRIVFTSNIDGFWLNGFELARFRYRDRNSAGVEFLNPRRYQEALITAYLPGNERWYACLGEDQTGTARLGYWVGDRGLCYHLDYTDGRILNHSRLIKFDPYFEWRYAQNGLPSSAVNFTQGTPRASYVCMIQLDNGDYYPGVVHSDSAGSCLAAPGGQILAFTKYWVFVQKP
ncbi:MAG: hypothetical protein ACOH5I_00740 [Oligoflexus sp.]